MGAGAGGADEGGAGDTDTGTREGAGLVRPWYSTLRWARGMTSGVADREADRDSPVASSASTFSQ